MASTEWHRQAACRKWPAEWWFPDHSNRLLTWRAKEVCATCPVRRECLADVLGRNEDYGIWGGLGARELDAYKRSTCRRCGRRATPEEAADLALRRAESRQWVCRTCWYRQIADRRRT